MLNNKLHNINNKLHTFYQNTNRSGYVKENESVKHTILRKQPNTNPHKPPFALQMASTSLFIQPPVIRKKPNRSFFINSRAGKPIKKINQASLFRKIIFIPIKQLR